MNIMIKVKEIEITNENAYENIVFIVLKTTLSPVFSDFLFLNKISEPINNKIPANNITRTVLIESELIRCHFNSCFQW